MVKKLKSKADASAAPPPKAAAPGSAKPGKFKKKLTKADPEKLKAAAAESTAIAEASASVPASKKDEVSAPAPEVTMAGPGSAKPGKFKKKLTKADLEMQKKAAAESAAVAEASASAPASKKDEVSAPPPARAATPNGLAAESNRGDRSNKKETMKGKGGDRKTSWKDMRKRREERMNREEKRRRTGKEKKKDGERSSTGFIFMCNATTKPECYRNGVFGLPRGKMDVVERIRPGAKLFLYDFDLKLMYGVYKATTRGGMDLVRHAFDGKFPAQVKFSVDIDCLPIPESSFKHAIKENYNSKGRFTQELSSEQVDRLLALFKPIGLSQPAPQQIEEMRRAHIVEDRRESYVYDERRPSQHVEERVLPINVHATHFLRPPFPNEPRHSLVLDRHLMPIGLESRQAPVALGSHHVSHMREIQHVPPMYYHQVASSSSYHQPHVDTMHERTAAEADVRDPLLTRDYEALPGEVTARADRLDELYRSYKLSTRTMDHLHQDPSYVTTSYENPRNIYSESVQRPVSTRVNGPSVPVSTRYSFAGPPAYR